MMTAQVARVSRPTILQMIEERIRLSTSNRVRNLAVEFEGERVVVRGQVPTRHAKQLALHAALEFVDGDQLHELLHLT